MPKNSIRLIVLKQVLKNAERIKFQVAAEANKVMKTEEAPAVQRRAKQLVPVKSGRLRDSGKIETTKGASATVTDVIFDTPYALKIHETHPTRSRFLERAMREAARGMTKRIASRLSQVLRKIVK